MVLTFDGGRAHRLIIIPAMFDEANKLRHHTVEVMHRLDMAGIDSFLPDLPGFNESRQPLEQQSLAHWRAAAQAAADQFGATHALSLRAGAIVCPPALPGWRYAPLTGAKALRALMMAQSLAAREAGLDEGLESLSVRGRTNGAQLAGWQLGPQLFTDLEEAVAISDSQQRLVEQEQIGGSGLWLRAEPGESAPQADALAAVVAMGLMV